jgi:phosphoglycolate phosphatase
MQHFIFDLDGTISNPELGILNGYKYTFPKVNLETPTDEVLKSLIGPPLRIVFENMYGLSANEADFAIKTYRVYYNELGGAYENNLYDGIVELITSLHQQNKKLHIATHKGAMTHQILTHFKIREYFSQIQHYDEENNIITKEKMISLILEKENIQDTNTVIMVGDRNTDIIAAKEIGIKSIGVLYGFGSVNEIENCQPTKIANNVPQLSKIIHQYI